MTKNTTEDPLRGPILIQTCALLVGRPLLIGSLGPPPNEGYCSQDLGEGRGNIQPEWMVWGEGGEGSCARRWCGFLRRERHRHADKRVRGRQERRLQGLCGHGHTYIYIFYRTRMIRICSDDTDSEIINKSPSPSSPWNEKPVTFQFLGYLFRFRNIPRPIHLLEVLGQPDIPSAVI